MQPTSFSDILGRALRLKCPACGQGKLYQGYLKPVDACSVCGTKWAEIQIADAAAWLVMLLVSFIAAPLATYLALTTDWPSWQVLALSSFASITISMAALPFAKAGFMAWMWSKNIRNE